MNQGPIQYEDAWPKVVHQSLTSLAARVTALERAALKTRGDAAAPADTASPAGWWVFDATEVRDAQGRKRAWTQADGTVRFSGLSFTLDELAAVLAWARRAGR